MLLNLKKIIGQPHTTAQATKTFDLRMTITCGVCCTTLGLLIRLTLSTMTNYSEAENPIDGYQNEDNSDGRQAVLGGLRMLITCSHACRLNHIYESLLLFC